MTNTLKRTIQIAITLVSLSIAGLAFAGETDSAQQSQVNINTATVVELAYLPGVGPSTAERIVQYRKGRPFQKPFHITRVKGIGRKTFKKLQPYLAVKGHTTATGKIRISAK